MLGGQDQAELFDNCSIVAGDIYSCVIVTQDKRLMHARAFCLTIAGRIPYEIESRPTAELNTYSTSTPSVLFAIPETN